MTPVSTAICWFRRDLRLADNPALAAALAGADEVFPLFVWDPKLAGPAGAPRLRFLVECLHELNDSLGGRLVVRTGDPTSVVPAIARETAAIGVWCAADFGPYGRNRDAAVASALHVLPNSPRLRQVGSSYAIEPGHLFTATGSPYRVFTPFSRAWRAHGWEPPIERPVHDVGRHLVAVASDPIPNAPACDAQLPEAGERAGVERLLCFLGESVEHYAERRDRPDLDATSRLSPYLRWGCVHPRQVLDRLDPTHESHRRFETELCWREFYADVLFHEPESARRSYRTEWRAIEWDDGPAADTAFDAWCQGRTGFPIVDAGMRQLLGEGWMHNRVRMLVASFLVKDLHLDWRQGARWFMQHLVDGDLASNQHGWQWVAGTGTDAAPYFRVFNPVAQGKRFDPDGEYIRRYVPELRHLPTEHVHEPWAADAQAARTAQGTLFGAAPTSSYPAPMVDHSAEREETLRRYSLARTPRT